MALVIPADSKRTPTLDREEIGAWRGEEEVDYKAESGKDKAASCQGVKSQDQGMLRTQKSNHLTTVS